VWYFLFNSSKMRKLRNGMGRWYNLSKAIERLNSYIRFQLRMPNCKLRALHLPASAWLTGTGAQHSSTLVKQHTLMLASLQALVLPARTWQQPLQSAVCHIRQTCVKDLLSVKDSAWYWGTKIYKTQSWTSTLEGRERERKRKKL
jgi:hypothetical protein